MDQDFQLVKLCQEGDRDAFRRLVEKYQGRIFNTVYSLIGDRDDADDITQEVFLKVYWSLPNFRYKSKFYTWLYRIAVNCFLDEMKKRRRRPTVISLEQALEDDSIDSGELFAESSSDPEDQAEKSQLQDAIQKILNTLSPKHRAIITLRDMEGFSQEETAEILGCSVGTVKSRLSRARESLKEKLRPLYDEWREP